MPLVRCPRCEESYDVPPQIAVRLLTTVGRCLCGERVIGDRGRLAQQVLDGGELAEIQLGDFAIDRGSPQNAEPSVEQLPKSRNVRLTFDSESGTIEKGFTIFREPMTIGRRGCHLNLNDPELSLKHCRLLAFEAGLFIEDADSHQGTFLDGVAVERSRIEPGLHLLRIGTSLLSLEECEDPGEEVRPLVSSASALLAPDEILKEKLSRRSHSTNPLDAGALEIVCLEGPLAGKTFEISPFGTVIGREGDIRIADDFLSRRHFSLEYDVDGTLRARDHQSRNGTLLNSLPLKNSRVADGDLLKAGISTFRVTRKP